MSYDGIHQFFISGRVYNFLAPPTQGHNWLSFCGSSGMLQAHSCQRWEGIMRASSWQSILSLLSWPSYKHKVLGVPRKDLEKCLIPREKRQQSLHEGRKALHCLGIHLGSIWPFSILSTHAPLSHMFYTGSRSPCKSPSTPRPSDFQPPGDVS